ncbi:MAG TPA: hypothetical protein VF791_22130 [Pyrinomonadaceae bacterium]
MSYHILHQFDEQWLADLKQTEGEDQGHGFLKSLHGERDPRQRAKLAGRESNRWLVVAAAILMATFALLFAIDASHRAETLQQRLDRIEATLRSK